MPIDKSIHKRQFAINQKSAKPKVANQLRKQRDQIVTRLSTINYNFIQKQLSEGQRLRALVACDQLANSQLLQLHCHKSGRPLHKLSLDDIHQTIAVHGETKAIEVLSIQYTNQTAPEWLFTDPESLTKLAKIDPLGYFIYSAGLIYSPIAVAKSGSMTTVHDVFDKTTINESDTKLNEVSANFQTKITSVRDRAISYQQLQSINPELIIELNELMRRMWGIVSPLELLRMHNFKTGKSLAYWTSGNAALQEFKQLLVDTLKLLASKKVNERINKTDIRYVSFAELCELQQTNKGLAQFRLQLGDKSKTSVDPEIMLSLRDFVADVTESNVATSPPVATAPTTQGQKPKFNTSGKIQLNIGNKTANSPKPSLAQLLTSKGQ